MYTEINTEEVVNNSNQPHNIETPHNVEDFRNNLKKYFVCIGDNDDELYVQNCDTDRINVNELNSLTDLYQRCNTEHFNPMISPKVNPKKDFEKFMKETNQIFSLNGYFMDENNYEIIEDRRTFLSDYEPKWVSLGNQIYREFYYLTMGSFSGYSSIGK